MNYSDNKMWTFIILLVVVFAMLVFSGNIATSRSETPKFEKLDNMEDKANKIEIRKYPSMLLIYTEIRDDSGESRKTGFKILADYIFGGNEKKQKIEMVTPVIQQKNENHWMMYFIAPAKYSLDEMPKPNNENIKIMQQDSKTYIAKTFSGIANRKSIKNNIELLESYCNQNQIKINNNPMILFYNPPFTLPFMRKNEILFEILE